MKINFLGAVRRTAGFISIVLLFLLGSSALSPLLAITPRQLRSRLDVKFRRVSSIYLNAVGFPVDDRSDSTGFIIGYRYPDRFLQVMRGRGERQQIVLFRGETLVIHYPHLEIYEEHSLSTAERDRLLVQNIPLAGLIAGLQSDDYVDDHIKTHDHGETVEVEIFYPDQRLEFDETRLVLKKSTLQPLVVETLGDQPYRFRVTDYQEDRRFPRPVERALENLDPRELVGEDL